MSGAIVWLASYPKSGNTWTRALLANYLSDQIEPVKINALGGGPIASARGVFDEHVGVEASDLTQDEIERYRPFVYEHISRDYEGEHPLFMKVHDAFTVTPYGYPLISKQATCAALYLIRNPLDVAVSFAHHSASTVEKIVRKMGDPEFCFVANPKVLHNQLRQRLLSWSQHVTSWVDEPGLPVHVVRYEDLLADTVGTFTGMLKFSGLEVDPARVEQAVEFSRFERLRAQERGEGFQEKLALAESFFRKGRAGDWRETLTPEQVEAIVGHHGEVMARFGYSADPVPS